MRCETARQFFSDYLDGTIDRPIAITLDHHLAECKDCAESYAAFKSICKALDSMPQVEPPVSFRRQVMARVIQERSTTSARRPFWSFDWGSIFTAKVPVRAYAAVLILMIMAAMMFQIGTQHNATISGSGSILKIEQPWPKNSNDLGRGNTGLRLSVTPQGNSAVERPYRIMVEPKGSELGDVKLYLLPVGTSSFTPTALEIATKMDMPIIRNRPVVMNLQPSTAYLEWTFKQEQFSEALFMPKKIAGTTERKVDFSAPGISVYSALAAASEVYGIVIVADADLGAGFVTVEPGVKSAEETLEEIVADVEGRMVRFDKMQDNVYAITRG